ncbi:uncharacterized protein LOC130267160 isoform X2 [Hyla sarda]|uniref:uncharacterized protein LOC130267160 isoform X2 n=1 Tax=Hyla sarda TaxID=327740 RepID=UPI0024C2FC80|nr:uncharacterized protein LOC130267160 isoform X2 [Hyla sarda]XP_056372468.1 uncharacterized protein LOC130267160 isoform X2 [Hyla sarda]
MKLGYENESILVKVPDPASASTPRAAILTCWAECPITVSLPEHPFLPSSGVRCVPPFQTHRCPPPMKQPGEQELALWGGNQERVPQGGGDTNLRGIQNPPSSLPHHSSDQLLSLGRKSPALLHQQTSRAQTPRPAAQYESTPTTERDQLSSTLPPPAQAVALLKGHPELQALLSFLPTKSDMSAMASDFKSAWCQDLQSVKQYAAELQGRVGGLEYFQGTVHDSMRDMQNALQPTSNHHALAEHLDDVENRSCRNNIRIRGLPTATRSQDLQPTVIGIFNMLLGCLPETHIEIDRVHRVLKAPSTDPARPRDVICSIHCYTLKEQIMPKIRH